MAGHRPFRELKAEVEAKRTITCSCRELTWREKFQENMNKYSARLDNIARKLAKESK